MEGVAAGPIGCEILNAPMAGVEAVRWQNERICAYPLNSSCVIEEVVRLPARVYSIWSFILLTLRGARR